MLRHDVDYDINWSLKIAEINKKLKIRACFFFLINSENYNFLTNHNIADIKRIIKLEQDIALHYDHRKGFTSIDKQFEIIKGIFPQTLRIYSLHNPPSNFNVINIKNRYKLKSVYKKPYFYSKNYISDSNLRYTPKEIFNEILLKKKNNYPIQLLFHPFNWVAQGNNMLSILNKTFKQKILILNAKFRENKNWNK